MEVFLHEDSLANSFEVSILNHFLWTGKSTITTSFTSCQLATSYEIVVATTEFSVAFGDQEGAISDPVYTLCYNLYPVTESTLTIEDRTLYYLLASNISVEAIENWVGKWISIFFPTLHKLMQVAKIEVLVVLKLPATYRFQVFFFTLCLKTW